MGASFQPRTIGKVGVNPTLMQQACPPRCGLGIILFWPQCLQTLPTPNTLLLARDFAEMKKILCKGRLENPCIKKVQDQIVNPLHSMNKCLQCTALIASADTSPQQQSRAKTKLGQRIHSMNKCLQCTALIARADTSPNQQASQKGRQNPFHPHQRCSIGP